jgi:hypothetical protein
MGVGVFSGNSNYNVDIDAVVIAQNASGNYSTVYWRVIVNKLGGLSYWGSASYSNSGWADSNLNANLWNASGFAYDFRSKTSITLAEGTFNVPHRADGTAEYSLNGGVTLVQLGTASAGIGTRSLPRIANVPEAPTPLPFGPITSSSAEFRFSGNGSGGGPIREWQVHYGTDPAAGQFAKSSTGSTVIDGLKPNSTYYFWARGRNDFGWGPFSSRVSAKTLNGSVLVKHNGVWKEAVPYVKHNGVWKLAVPYVKHNGVWKTTQ